MVKHSMETRSFYEKLLDSIEKYAKYFVISTIIVFVVAANIVHFDSFICSLISGVILSIVKLCYDKIGDEK